jgi:hypothetical protein
MDHMRLSRGDVLRYRVRAQELDRAGARRDAAVLDIGVQDTGPDGAGWALTIRGAAIAVDDLALAWTLRGAPHFYRRREIAAVAAATAPWSDADAAKRIFDAARPLRAAGIPVLEALGVVAAEMHDIATKPVVKGEMSTQLTGRLGPPYLRECRPCQAVHTYEQPFRLAALRAGLELEPDTSPPVLRRIPRWRGPAAKVPEHLGPVRGVLHFLGPATPKLVAAYIDAPVGEVSARWPSDVTPVEVDGQRLDALADDVPALTAAEASGVVRLLGPFDLFLQGRDRELVVPDPAARKDLWRTLGRPGGVLAGDEVVGSWRPRASGKKLRLAVSIWDGGDPPVGLDIEAQRLAAFRGLTFAGYVDE